MSLLSFAYCYLAESDSGDTFLSFFLSCSLYNSVCHLQNNKSQPSTSHVYEERENDANHRNCITREYYASLSKCYGDVEYNIFMMDAL